MHVHEFSYIYPPYHHHPQTISPTEQQPTILKIYILRLYIIYKNIYFLFKHIYTIPTTPSSSKKKIHLPKSIHPFSILYTYNIRHFIFIPNRISVFSPNVNHPQPPLLLFYLHHSYDAFFPLQYFLILKKSVLIIQSEEGVFQFNYSSEHIFFFFILLLFFFIVFLLCTFLQSL